MSLSVKKTLTEILSESSEQLKTSFDLLQSEIRKGEQAPEVLDLDSWPILQFLKGMGFEYIHFHSNNSLTIETWAQRIADYELAFLEDPENLAVSDTKWNEIDIDSRLLIECVRSKETLSETRSLLSFVPPMEAPLGLDPETVRRFSQEVEVQSTKETILRTQSILSEFIRGTELKDPAAWAALVADTISIALENKLLDKACEIAEDQVAYLKPLWDQDERSLRLFTSYDPKPNEVVQWVKIFKSCDTPHLIRLVEMNLGTSAGPQILKLMNYRSQTTSEEFISHFFQEKSGMQRFLLPLFSVHWKAKHFAGLKNQITKAFDTNDEPMSQLWLQAMLRSDSPQTLNFLKEFFKKKFNLFKRKQPHSKQQRIIIDFICENPNSETLGFAREIKAQVGGELRDKLEKFIHSYSV